MARLYDDTKKRETAKKLIDAAVKAAPEDPAVLLAAAQWYLGQNDLENAKRIADDALKIDAKSLEGRVVRGAIARVSRITPRRRSFSTTPTCSRRAISQRRTRWPWC